MFAMTNSDQFSVKHLETPMQHFLSIAQFSDAG